MAENSAQLTNVKVKIMMCSKADIEPKLEQINQVFTDKKEAILSVMNSVGPGAIFNPAQIQQVLFLLDRNAEANNKSALFCFDTTKYGIFDQSVYQVLEELSQEDYVETLPGRAYKRFVLKTKGFEKSGKITALNDDSSKGLQELVEWILRHRYIELLSAIYAKYPCKNEKSTPL